MTNEPSKSELAVEMEDLRARLADAEEALHAIRNGEVDGVVVAGGHGEQVYTLSGADRSYRRLIETMREGALTLSADGVILYCNISLAELLGQPLDQVLGSTLRNHLPPADQQALDAMLGQAGTAPSRREINLQASDGRLVPVYLSASHLRSEEGAETVFCLVLTDLTEQKSHEQIVAASERIRKLNRVYAMLSNINQAIVRIREPQALYEEACRIAVEDGGFRMAWIGLADPASRRVLPAAHAGVADGYVEKLDIVLGDDVRGRGPTGRAVRSGKHLVCNDIANDPCMAPWREDALRNGYHSSATFPLKASGDEVRGAFGLYAAESAFFDDDEVKLLDELATDIGFALEFVEKEAERKQADEALRQSEERFRILFEQAADSILLLEIVPEGIPVIRDANSATFRLLGYERDELIGQPVSFIDTAPDASALIQERRQDIQSGKATMFEARHRCKDGTIRDFECSVTEHQIDSKTFAISVERDITERKKTEETLRKSEERFRYVLENVQDALWAADLSGQFEYMSPNMASIYGKPLSEMVANPAFWIEAVHPEDQTMVRASNDALFRDGHVELEYRILLPDGAIRWIFDRKTLLRNKHGEASGMAGIVSDITERKLVEETLQKQVDELRRWHEVTLGRETRVLELKCEVNELLGKGGQPPRYDSAGSGEGNQ